MKNWLIFIQTSYTKSQDNRLLNGLRMKGYVLNETLTQRNKLLRHMDLSMVNLLDDIFPLLFMMML